MKVKYDKTVDAAHIQLSSRKPDGAVEIAEGVILHTTARNELVAIEILDTAKKFPIKTLYKLRAVPICGIEDGGSRHEGKFEGEGASLLLTLSPPRLSREGRQDGGTSQ